MCDRPVVHSKDQVADLDQINLTDCLSCAGCVSISEEDSSYAEAISLIEKGMANIVITPQVKMSLFQEKGQGESFRVFEYFLVEYLSKNGNTVIDSTVGTKILLKEEIEGIDRKETNISTICPGTVLYLSSSLDRSEKFLNRNLSPVEISAKFLSTVNSNPAVSIVMCKDKKIEAKNNSIIKYSITTKELYDNLLKKENKIFYSNTLSDKITEDRIKEMYESSTRHSMNAGYDRYTYSVSRPLKGSTSGGIFEEIILQLGIKNNRNLKIDKIKDNPKHKELSVGTDPPKKFLQLFSSTRIVSFISKVKKDVSILAEYSYIEMNMCAGGCLNGPSQKAPVDKDIYAEIQKDRISQEKIKLPDMENIKRSFISYKKPKEKKNYLVQW